MTNAHSLTEHFTFYLWFTRRMDICFIKRYFKMYVPHLQSSIFVRWPVISGKQAWNTQASARLPHR